MDSETPLNYSGSGVDIDAGHELVERIKPLVKSTHRAGCVGNIGGFGGLFELPLSRYRNPLLVSGTDGVGTKLKLAVELQQYHGIGIDLVAMSANDIAVLGAEALFFLDYYATGKLHVDIAESIIHGIAKGCKLAGCALIGGETAEMPGIYSNADFDLAGFCVGIVEKDQIIDGSRVSPGDSIIALASSGPHANGYSLIRKIITISGASLSRRCGDQTLAKALIKPTRIYAQNLLTLSKMYTLNAIAHITGGGLLENIPRILPAHCTASIDLSSWTLPSVFRWLQETGNLQQTELYRTFNCGVGMILIVKSEDQSACLKAITELGEQAWVIGEVVPKRSEAAIVLT